MTDPAERPDLAILLTGSVRVVADRLGRAVQRAGVEDMRTPYGFVIRALAAADRSLTELADLLGVTKQSAIKLVDEMERRGFVSRQAHPSDRRVKLLRLTAKGRRVHRAALAESQRLERELAQVVGAGVVADLRRALAGLLELHGELDAALGGRSRAPW